MEPVIEVSSIGGIYSLFVFDVGDRKDHNAAQPNNVELKVYDTRGILIVSDYTAFAFFLTNRLVTIISDRS